MGGEFTPGTAVAKLAPMRAFMASLLVITAVAAGSSQQPTFRAGGVTVMLPATVLDSTGRLVPALEKEQFLVLDNGKPQPITVFENSTEPFTAVVMMDFSASMTLHLERLKQAAEQFSLRMLPQDKAQVGAFSDRIQFSGEFTNDRDDLIFALKDLQFGNPTRLYDAVYESMAMLAKTPGRKVVVVFTDGEDTASRRGFGDVLDRAREENVIIYSIGLESEITINGYRQRTRPDRGLRRLSEQTGGGFFELKKSDELGPTFTRVAQELHSLYTIGFTPPAIDGKEHRIEVKTTQQGTTVRTRRSYIAVQEKLVESP